MSYRDGASSRGGGMKTKRQKWQPRLKYAVLRRTSPPLHVLSYSRTCKRMAKSQNCVSNCCEVISMPDNKKVVGKVDRDCASAKEPYEVRALAKKVDLPVSLVTNVTRQVGPSRTKVEQKLNQMKRNRRK